MMGKNREGVVRLENWKIGKLKNSKKLVRRGGL